MKLYIATRMIPLLLACAAIGTAFADVQSGPLPPPPPPPVAPKPIDQNGPRVSRPPIQEITPSAGPRVVHGADVFITADFLWWRAREDGLSYAYTNTAKTATNPGRGRTHRPNFDWDPGFKVGLGLNLSRDGWDVFAQYTWMRANNSRDSLVQTVATASMLPIVNTADANHLSANNTYYVGRGEWDLHFNVIDLEIGRNFFISQYLTLRPHAGLKGTWQDQKYRVHYELQNNSSQTVRERIRMEQDYWGIGTRIGLDMGWQFIRSFGIFSNWSLTALWTDFDIDRRDTSINLATQTTALTKLKTKNDFSTVKPLLEFVIGLRWETWWDEDDYHFSLEAGWEEQIWWSFNQFIHLNEESAHGDLTLHGLTLKARFDF